MFVKFIVSIALCLLVSRVDGASPTIAPTVGKNDIQIQGNGYYPGVSVGPDTSAIFVIGTRGFECAITKCPTDSIAYSDCDTWLRGDEYFYDYDQTTLLDGTNSNPTVQLKSLVAYGTGNYYGGNLYFMDKNNNEVYRCTGKSKCSKYLDATVAPVSSSDIQDFIMSSTGVMYLSDNDNGKVWRCTGASSTGAGICTDLGFAVGLSLIPLRVTIGTYNKIALDQSETYIYVRDSVGNQIFKCAISAGPSCSVYLQSTTPIGYDITDAALTLSSSSSNDGIAVDSSGSVYVYLGEVYKCTAVDTCSLFLNRHGINPGADDGPFIGAQNYGMKIDSSGFMYIATYTGIVRYGATSSSSFSLNAKMYGIIVLVLFPFAVFFACGYLFAKHRFGYTQAATKETEMVTHTTSV
jgi:hypothetical protein